MSHFSVAVFSQDMNDVADLLAPFIEQVEPSSPYAEFVKNDRADYDETAKAKGYWHNPNAKWDWYEIGGRWRGMLRLLPGRKGYRAPLDEWTKDFVYPENACDGALVKDCDFSGDSAAYAKALRRWEVVVEGAKARDSDEEFLNLWKPEYYLERYGTKEAYARHESAFSTYAFISADGEWHAQGRMGWFGFDDATKESMAAHEQAFEAYLEEAKRQGLMIVIVDCHI